VKALRVPVESLNEGELCLDLEASNYVLRVHRVGIGEPLVLFDPYRAVEADARLSGSRGKVAVCEVTELRPSTAVPTLPLVLIQAYAKGDKVERVVKDATALGVTQVVVVTTERAVVQVRADEVSHRRERFERIAVEAARQCGRGDVPGVIGPLSLDEYLKNPGGLPAERLVLSPAGAMNMSDWSTQTAACPLALFIGPEGGLDERELTQLNDCGFRSLRFSDFVLRTETAATAVLGAIAMWQRR
jgi:16S rRNA (uracil1498-N3)-methyltransferase